MEQGQAAKDVVPAEVWGQRKAEAEVEWVAHLPQDQVEIVSAQTVANRFLIL